MSKIINLYGSDTDSDEEVFTTKQKNKNYEEYDEEEEEEDDENNEEVSSSNEINSESEKEEEDESNDESNDNDTEEEEEEEESQGFSVREDFYNEDEDADEIYKKELQKKKEKKEKKKKEEEIPLEEIPIGKPKYVKPLDYQKLKLKKKLKGVVFLSRPPKEYCNKDKLISYLEPYGTVTRIKEDYRVKANRKTLNGYYIEFEKKSIAKRVALSLNMHKINFRDSRMLQFKYMPNFDFTELEEDDALDKLKKKLLIAEAEKELRQVKQYSDYKHWSDRVKSGETAAPAHQLKFNQQKMKRERDTDYHLHFLPESNQKVDIVVCPSLSFDQEEVKKVHGAYKYEERQLYNIFLLKNPNARMIFMTSEIMEPTIIDYYCGLVAGQDIENVKERIFFVSPDDFSPIPLSKKVYERSSLLKEIKGLIRDVENAYMIVIRSTEDEIELAKALDIPLLAADPSFNDLGTKHGSKCIFKETGILYPDSSNECFTDIVLAQEIIGLWKKNPNIDKMMIKLNDSFSGNGNAILNLSKLKKKILKELKVEQDIFQCEKLEDFLLAEFYNLKFIDKETDWESFYKKFKQMGGIAELFLVGVASPSGQACITLNGDVSIISTHEQVFTGPDKQVYLGCSFPSNDIWRLKVQELTRKIGLVLASKGVIEHFGVDYMVVPKDLKMTKEKSMNPENYDFYAIEINLRACGTTHPMMSLKLLSDGEYSDQTGEYISKKSQKYYFATDNVFDTRFIGNEPKDLIKLFSKSDLLWNSKSEKGCLFHMLGGLNQFGKFGLVSIGNSIEEANYFYSQSILKINESFLIQ
eukprot:gene458-6869_t